MSWDFLVRNHGSVWEIEALSDRAKEFAQERLNVELVAGSPERFTADHGPARKAVVRLINEGFNVGAAQ